MSWRHHFSKHLFACFCSSRGLQHHFDGLNRCIFVRLASLCVGGGRVCGHVVELGGGVIAHSIIGKLIIIIIYCQRDQDKHLRF